MHLSESEMEPMRLFGCDRGELSPCILHRWNAVALHFDPRKSLASMYCNEAFVLNETRQGLRVFALNLDSESDSSPEQF